MAWSSDHKRFFFSDSLEYAVFKYDYDIDFPFIGDKTIAMVVEKKSLSKR